VLAMLKLYKSPVVPVLEYAFSYMGFPHQEKYTQKLELVRKHVTKAILGHQAMDYETQLCVVGVSLEEHRRAKDLVTCYK